MELVVFVGVQGSGKSTFYKERFFDTHLRISLDMLRTRHREAQLVSTCLALRQPFVIDNTNPTRAERSKYIEAACACGCPAIAYHFATRLASCLSRNAARSSGRVVPPAGVVATSRRLQAPTCEEGFSAVYKVTLSETGTFMVETAETRGSPNPS